MSIHVFIDDDDGYRDWLIKHPRGYVINIDQSLNPSEARLHDADCRTLTSQLDLDVKLTYPYIKVCGETLAEVEQWPLDKVGEPIDSCGHCRDGGAGPTPPDPRRICPKCFLELPVTGKCPNCD